MIKVFKIDLIACSVSTDTPPLLSSSKVFSFSKIKKITYEIQLPAQQDPMPDSDTLNSFSNKKLRCKSNTIDKIFKDIDVLVTCNTALIKEYKKWMKHMVLFSNEQNSSFEHDKKIYSLEEFINYYKNNILNV